MKETTKVIKYIKDNWETTYRPAGEKGHGNIPMPHPFTVPCAKELFTDFYYWDTYFTNIGLMISGRSEQVVNNLDNMKYFVETLGFVPNANHIIDRSQPPLFTRGVFDYYQFTKDKSIIEKYIDSLIKEHEFFMTKRTGKKGLASYSTGMNEDELVAAAGIVDRIGIDLPKKRKDVIALSRNIYAIAESGWDFNPRFNTKKGVIRTDEFFHIDLNSLLYDEETKISKMLKIIGRDEDAKIFAKYAQKRKRLVNKYLKEKETGIYKDYNFKDKEFSAVYSVASFYPYAFKMSKDVKSAKELLKKLELPFGLSTCEERPGDKYLQWDFPAMWPSNVYFTVTALENLGLKEDAKRIAEKYVTTATRIFLETGSLWEKYDALLGKVSVTTEYETPKMLGWTAGVYLYLSKKYKF